MTTLEELEARLAILEERAAPAPLAVAPITIGELTDVPTPGAPIASQWAQEVSGRVVHRFATVAARNTAWPAATAGNGAVCETSDTGTLWIVVAGVWVQASPATPRGYVAVNITTTQQGGFGTTPIAIGTAVTFTFDGARWVEITASIPVAIGSGSSVAIGAMTITGGAGTLVTGGLQLLSNGGTGYLLLRWQGKVASGSKTVGFTLAANAGTVQHNAAVTSPSMITVVDLGI